MIDLFKIRNPTFRSSCGLILFSLFLCSPGFSGVGIVENVTLHDLDNHNEKFGFTDTPAGTVTISWTSSVPGSSQVIYGLSESNLEMSSRFDPRLKTKHIMRIQYRLAEGQTYFFKVRSKDAAGNAMESTIDSFMIPTDSAWWEVAHDRYRKRDDFDSDTRWISGGNYYRHEFTLTGNPETAFVQMNRWERYDGGIKLYVNGSFAGFWSFGYVLNTLDISSFLQTGVNTLALEVQNPEPARVLLEGEVVFDDDSFQIFQTKTGGWVTVISAPSGWEQPGFDDSTWNLVNEAGTPGATTGTYSPYLISELPLQTSLNASILAYTRSLARRDRLLEQRLESYRNNRTYLDVPSSDKSLAETIALKIVEQLFDSQIDLDTAQAFILANDDASAQLILATIGTDLDLLELMCDGMELLMQGSACMINLVAQAAIAGSSDLDATISEGQLKIDTARDALLIEDYPTARSNLLLLEGILGSALARFQCGQDLWVSQANESGFSPFGWIRSRGQYIDRIFGGRYELKSCFLALGTQAEFAAMPPDLNAVFRDSADFISPFVGFNTAATTADLSLNMTHVAYSLPGGIASRATSLGTLYDGSGQDPWNRNWLLIWDELSSNKVYLLAFKHQPDTISFVNNRVRITRAAGVGDCVIFPMYPQGLSLTSNTQTIGDWDTTLPNAVSTDIETLSKMMVYLPLGYSESYQVDELNGLGLVTMKYRYFDLDDDWMTLGTKIAPCPNALTFAAMNGYSGLSVGPAVMDTRWQTGGWGPFEVAVGTDTFSYSFPILNPNPLNGVNESITKGFIKSEDIAQTGFNAIRGQIIIQEESGGFVLRSGWESILQQELTEANSAGLTAVFFVWNNGGKTDSLDTNSSFQDAFVNSWGQIASIAQPFDVVYDLTNEPDFDSASTYNEVMSRAASAIRVADTVNPVTIEGFRDYSQDFSGMVHPADLIPGIDNIWFQFHPYANSLHANASTIDQYYPGYLMSWYNNGYYDRDAYLADRWIPAIKTMLADDRIRLINGEYGFQRLPRGVAENMADDTVFLARRFQAHQLAFVSTGWSGFDFYGGQGDTFMERTEVTDILMKLTRPDRDTFCGLLNNLPAWWNTAVVDSCGQSGTSVLDLVQFIQNGFACQAP